MVRSLFFHRHTINLHLLSICEMIIIFNWLTTNVAHVSTTNAGHHIATHGFYETSLTFITIPHQSFCHLAFNVCPHFHFVALFHLLTPQWHMIWFFTNSNMKEMKLSHFSTQNSRIKKNLAPVGEITCLLPACFFETISIQTAEYLIFLIGHDGCKRAVWALN